MILEVEYQETTRITAMEVNKFYPVTPTQGVLIDMLHHNANNGLHNRTWEIHYGGIESPSDRIITVKGTRLEKW